MADAINQTGLVIHLLVQHTGEVSINFIHILPILDVLLQMMEHISNLNICTSVKRAFQRTDTCGNGRIRVCAAGRNDTYRKGRVVTTAMLCLKHQQKIQRAGIQFRIIFLQHIEEILGYGQVLARMADMQ